MNLYEVTLHGTDSIYLLASTKYRALELAGDYPAAPRQRLVPDSSNSGCSPVVHLLGVSRALIYFSG